MSRGSSLPVRMARRFRHGKLGSTPIHPGNDADRWAKLAWRRDRIAAWAFKGSILSTGAFGLVKVVLGIIGLSPFIVVSGLYGVGMGVARFFCLAPVDEAESVTETDDDRPDTEAPASASPLSPLAHASSRTSPLPTTASVSPQTPPLPTVAHAASQTSPLPTTARISPDTSLTPTSARVPLPSQSIAAEQPPSRLERQWRQYRLIGLVVIVASLFYTGYAVRLFFTVDPTRYGFYVALGIATVTFVELGVAIQQTVARRHDPSPLVHAAKLTSLASALTSLALVQIALRQISDPTLVQPSPTATTDAAPAPAPAADAWSSLAATADGWGGLFCGGLATLVGLYMVVHATRRIKTIHTSGGHN